MMGLAGLQEKIFAVAGSATVMKLIARITRKGRSAMDELKPCPFCGEQPEWTIVGENNDLLRFGCLKNMMYCVVWVIPFTRPYHENALQEAVRRWNRRPCHGTEV